MILGVLVFLASQGGGCPGTDSANLVALKYLARHRSAEGSWGSFSLTCRCRIECPLETPLNLSVDDCTREACAALIRSFEREEIEIRDDAQDQLWYFGARAVPELQRGMGSSDPEVSLRSRRLLHRLWSSDPETQELIRRAGQESFASELETTGLVLLGFLGAGYSSFSRDEFPDPVIPGSVLRFGPVVKKGLAWLIDQQDNRGSWKQGTPVAQAIASLALNEGYGMTVAPWLKEPASLAYQAVQNNKCTDERFLAWKALLLISGDNNDLGDARKGKALRLAKQLSLSSGRMARAAAFLLRLRFAGIRDESLINRFAQLDPSALGPEELFFVSLGVFHWGGPSGLAWKNWSEPLKARFVPYQVLRPLDCRMGSWEGADRIWTTAFDHLTLMLYYRYLSHFGIMGYPIPVEGPPAPAPKGAARR